ncbi:cystatin domain-containing protein [Vibrio aphrogenes]|uniref:cystatin domain-containing protein n=1 Tax=Vibrio aphrogenes TaxID=1891186 RepID=UPI000B350F01|nr:cystatin domain-containing protein [Vibrio aphrogenes]
MYKNILAISTITLAMTACSATPPTENPELTMKCETVKSMPGGWQEAEISAEVKQSALLAVASLEGNHSVKSIQRAQQQVVAGMNYKVEFTIEDDTTYTAKVYKDLKGQYKIISIQPQSLLDECLAQQDAK